MNAKSACCDKDGLKKGPWTPEEDQKLIDYIKKQGHGRWRTLPKNAGLKRCGKSCRLRWTNYLRPDIRRGKFSFEEEEAIIQLHSVLGNKWSTIASRLPGRTDNEIKNYWNTHIRKRLMKMGIDPVTHAPRMDLLELSSLLNSRLNDSSSNSSSQLNQVPNYLLGNMPLMNENLLNLATSLLSYQPKTSTANTSSSRFATQDDVHETLVLDTQNATQSQFPSLEQSHFQTCLTPSTSVSYEAHESTQMMRSKLEPLSRTLMEGFSINSPSTNSLANTWQNSNFQDQNLIRSTPSDESFVTTNNTGNSYPGYRDSTQSSPMVHSSLENQGFVLWNAPHSVGNVSLSSLLSTPSSSPYVNYSRSNSVTHDDERDSLCKNMFVYDLDNFAFNGNEFV